MAKVLPPLRVNGVTYRVLRLDGGARGPRFLLRSDAGDLFGLWPQNAAPTRLQAAPLVRDLHEENPLRQVDFFDTDGGLRVFGVELDRLRNEQVPWICADGRLSQELDDVPQSLWVRISK